MSVNAHHPPPTTAALPSGKAAPKSPKAKDVLFGTLEKITRQPSLKQDRSAKNALREASFRVKALEKSPQSNKSSFDSFHPEDYYLKEGEQRKYLDPKSEQLDAFKNTVASITDWMNNVLEDSATRIRVENIETDLFDGLVLKVLVQTLSGQDVPMPAGEFVQSKERQRINLAAVLNTIQDILKVPEEEVTWDVESICDSNLLSIMSLLLAVASRFSGEGKALVDLPQTLWVRVITVRRMDGNLTPEITRINLIRGCPTTSSRDGFDTLIDHAPEKLHYVKQSLLQFANAYLGKVGRTVVDIGEDFRDGVNFLLLIGLLEGFFVPLYEYHRNPKTPEDRLSNLNLAFQFLSSAGIKPRNRSADVARGDIKAILRLLYCLFVKYKNGEAGDSKSASPTKTGEEELGMSREASQSYSTA